MATFIAPIQTELGIDAAGIASVESDEANSRGWRLAGTGAENVPAGLGTLGWFIGSRITTRLATSTGDAWVTMSAGNDTQALRAYNFDFTNDIDSSATIVGVEVMVPLATTPGNTDLQCTVAWGASAVTQVATPETQSNPSVGVLTFGGPTDLWGEGSIATSDVRTTDFGCFLIAQSSTGAGTFRVDAVGMKIHFTDTADGTVRVVQQYVEVLSTESLQIAGASDNRAIVVT